MTSPRAFRPFITTPGYFIVRRDADVAVDPLDLGLLVREAALGHEIEDVADSSSAR